MIDSEKIIRAFIAHFEKSWPESFAPIMEYLADDATYQMVVPTTEPVRGKPAILAALVEMKDKVPDQKHDLRHVAANGNVVFTERVDYSFRNGKWVKVPLIGVFEVNDQGKISQWREYLDMYHNLREHQVSLEEMKKSDKNYTLASSDNTA